MATRNVLVRLPAHPFSFESLIPARSMASLAASILDAGHWAQVWDYGTVEVFERLTPKRPSKRRHRSAKESAAFRLPRTQNQAAGKRRQDFCAAVAKEIASQPGLDAVVFDVEYGSQFPNTLAVAERVRELRPALRITATGSWLTRLAGTLSQTQEAAVFDCLLTGDPETAVVEWIDRTDRSPSLLRASEDLALDGFAVPTYAPAVYPALHESTKLRLFTLEDSRGCEESCHACSLAGLSNRKVRLRSPGGVCHEMIRLATAHGARAFRFGNPGSPAPHADVVARAIEAHRLAVSYSRPIQLCYAKPALAASLSASGCLACSIRLDTGSQILLDDYYARGFTVTQAEEMIRACVSEDLFTTVHFTYPCPIDDYHSRAETFRIINRTHPHAVNIGFPNIEPSADWHDWAEDFGFRVTPQRYQQWALAGAPLDDVPYRVGKWSARNLAREREELMDEVREVGVALDIPADMALVARVTGHGGHEDAFARDFAYHILEGDADGLAESVAAFNAQACLRSGVAAFTPDVAFGAAVAN